MASTPPPTRARTPPTPLHGPRFDAYEPFSPRRSTRQRKMETARQFPKDVGSLRKSPSSPRLSHSAAQPTPRKYPKGRTSSLELSPPTSPVSTNNETTSRDAHFLRGMLPTPIKTPRKRDLHGEVKLTTTARVLFPSRALVADDAMPMPRRFQRGRKHTAFRLDDLEEGGENGGSIQVYTDSRDRIPEIDENEDNPFVVRRSNRKKQSPVTINDMESQSPKPKYGMTAEIDQAVENGEGVVYVFRGKKIFRKFDDKNETHSASSDGLGDVALGRSAGATSRGRLTRSSVKPRLLFPPREPTPVPDEIDEEAPTDIEDADAGLTPDMEEDLVTTPVKQQSFMSSLTPPTTGRKIRHMPADIFDSQDLAPAERSNPFRPFDAWQRAKPAGGRDLGSKRPGEPIAKSESGTQKRTRSGQYLFG